MAITNVRGPLLAATPVTGGVPNVRAPLVVTEILTGGNPNVHAAMLSVRPLTGGNPNVRASLINPRPVTGGNPNVRASLILVSAVIPEPEELPVATDIFPVLRGRTWEKKKSPEFNTAVHGVTSGRETRTAFMQYPWWNFEFTYDYLPDITPGVSGFTDLDTLRGFFLRMQGSFKAWLYQDLEDYTVRGGLIAVADGATLQWPLFRGLGGFYEPAGQIDLSTVAAFLPAAVNTTAHTITIPSHGLATGAGPYYAVASATLPAPLAVSTPYWAIVVDANTLQLAASKLNALAATAIAISSTGTGNLSLTKGLAVYEKIAESNTVPAPSGPYTVTVAHAAAYLTDGGVTLGGAPLAVVSSSPAAGQYSVNLLTGVYTFNVAQASAVVVVTYTYAATASTVTITLPNQLVITPAPAVGITVTADFDFYFVCRFMDDAAEFSEFMSRLWNLQKLTFRSVIQ